MQFVTLKSTARSTLSRREQRLAKQRMAVSINDHILAFGEVFEPRSLPSNSFNVRFAVFLTLRYTWPTFPKACATPTNSNTHVSPVGSKVIDMRARGIHCKYVHLVQIVLILLGSSQPYMWSSFSPRDLHIPGNIRTQVPILPGKWDPGSLFYGVPIFT